MPPREGIAVIESVRFRAGRYRLEGELLYPDESSPRGVAVMAGPHPLLGGSMRNNVVQNLSDGLARRGLAALRFNYRGVGNSDGPGVDVARQMAEFWQTSHVASEDDYQTDLDGAVAFLRADVSSDVPLALIGYSFGSTLLAAAAPAGTPTALVLIAPTVGKHNYDGFVPIRQPKLVIAPEGDFAADATQLRAWFARLAEPKQLIQQQLDNHFFRGHEDWLAETVSAFLDGAWR
jgi:uncharacterized protein